MAVKMRLMRMGKKKSAQYRVVVIDGRAPRDGRYIDQIGRYDPNEKPSLIEIDNEKAVDWLRKGVQPTEAVAKLLEISGAMARFKVASGKIHTVAARTAAKTDTEEETEVPVAEGPSEEEQAATTPPVAATPEEAAPEEAASGEEAASAEAAPSVEEPSVEADSEEE